MKTYDKILWVRLQYLDWWSLSRIWPAESLFNIKKTLSNFLYAEITSSPINQIEHVVNGLLITNSVFKRSFCKNDK